VRFGAEQERQDHPAGRVSHVRRRIASLAIPVSLWFRERMREVRDKANHPGTLGLGVWLIARRALVVVALGLAVVAAIVAVGVAVARRGAPSAASIPTHASVLIAWSVGVMVAFGGAFRAIPSDADEGIVALLRARGVSVTSYVRGRVGGLVAVIALGVGGAVLAADVAALLAAPHAAPAAKAAAAALVYALAFAATLGPLAMATLAARTRGAGYLTFVAVLVVPEATARWTATLLPSGWHELTSIPAALEAVQAGVLAPMTEGFAMARAVAALAALAVLALAVVHTRIPRVDGGGAA
jgi:hypothetical protein